MDAPPQYHCKVIWNDKTFFEANLNQENIRNLLALDEVFDVEEGDEV